MSLEWQFLEPIVKPSAQKGDAPEQDDGLAVVTDRPKLKPPRRFAAVLHNDDYTTMEFVIEVLQKVFNRSHSDAMAIMLEVHHKGRGVAGIYSLDIAETKVAIANERAKAQGFPFKCTVEPDST